VLQQVFNVTSPGGLFLFSTLGPDTLKEFRASWEAVDLTPHTNDFIDMHDIGDALLQSGFQDPVIETEYLTIEYPSAKKLMGDLKGIGAQNSHPNRARGLTGKKQFQEFTESYETFRRPNGLLPVTYEVIYGLAWIPATKPEPTLNALNLHCR
jgi:malonyl-CoA O-methyltransferase